MPSDKDHKYRAAANLRFLQSFYPSREYDDWAVTVAFYMALHIIEYAFFVSDSLKYREETIELRDSAELKKIAGEKGIPPPRNYSWATCSHHIMRNLLVESSFPPEICDSYKLLYKESKRARYWNFAWNPLEIPLIIHEANSIIDWANKQWKLELSRISDKPSKSK